MAYNFSIVDSTLVVTLDTESGKFSESVTTYSQPNLVLGNDRIFLKEEGLFLQEFVFDNIGDINGDTATNLISAYELLDSLIKSIFVTTTPVDSRIYKVYTALLTQTGTGAPTATVLENTLGFVPTFTYNGVGIYRLVGTFDITKTIVIFENPSKTSIDSTTSSYNVGSRVNLYSRTGGVLADNMLDHTSIKIEVYN